MIEHVERIISDKHYVALKSDRQRLLSTLDPKYCTHVREMGHRGAHTSPIELILVLFERAQNLTPGAIRFPSGGKSPSHEKASERSYKGKKVTVSRKRWKIEKFKWA